MNGVAGSIDKRVPASAERTRIEKIPWNVHTFLISVAMLPTHVDLCDSSPISLRVLHKTALVQGAVIQLSDITISYFG